MPISRILGYRHESVSASGVSVGVCALVAFRDDENLRGGARAASATSSAVLSVKLGRRQIASGIDAEG